jgi:hypothetical protein
MSPTIKNGSKTEKAGLHLYIKFYEAVLLRKKIPMTINVENLAEWVNRKWMSYTPEIESHDMG